MADSSKYLGSAAGGGDDPIFALNAEAKRRAASGEEVVNATIGALVHDDGRLAVMPTVIEAFREAPLERAAGYAPIAGDPTFLSAVVTDLFGDGALASRSAIVATPGGSGALHLAITNFLRPGDRLLTSRHYWGPYETMATHTGRGVATFETFDEDLRFDVAAFGRGLDQILDEQGRALVILNFPCHNPTGYSLDDDEWTAVTEHVRRAGERGPVTVLIDHAYAAFGAAGSDGWTRHAEAMTDHALVLVAWTASKSFAQYGSRIGALVVVTPDEVERTRIAATLSYACRATWSNCNHLGQLVIGGLLSDDGRRATIADERAALVDLLSTRVTAFCDEASQRKIVHPRYEGGFFVAVPTEDAESCAAAMRDDGVFVIPIDRAVRVALCSTSAGDVPRLVDSLARQA